MRMPFCTSQARALQDLLWKSNNGKAFLLTDDVPWEPKISVFIQVSLRTLLLLGMSIDTESRIWGCIRRGNIKYSLCGKWTENPIVLSAIYSFWERESDVSVPPFQPLVTLSSPERCCLLRAAPGCRCHLCLAGRWRSQINSPAPKSMRFQISKSPLCAQQGQVLLCSGC